jgi:hypothetical protein
MSEAKFVETNDLNEYFTRGYEYAEKDLEYLGDYVSDERVIAGCLRLAYLLWPDDNETFKPHIRMFLQVFRDGYRAHKTLKVSERVLIEDLKKLSVDTAIAFNSIEVDEE